MPRASLLTEQQARTLRALQGRPQTRTELAATLGLQPSAATYRLRDLELLGYVDHGLGGRYSVTQDGAEILSKHTRRVRAKYGRAA